MKDEISAFLDDELTPEAADRMLEALNRDRDLREAWETYHLIGDALRRTPDLLSPEFSERVMTHISEGPAVFAPGAAGRSAEPGKGPMHFLLSLAASVMGVGAVAWMTLSFRPSQMEPASMAAALPAKAKPAAPAAVSPPGNGEEKLKEYIVAHRAYSASAGMGGVAPYVRSVSVVRSGEE